MATTPNVFVANDLVPDPHNAIYSPRILGRNGNYVNFISDTPFINDTWLMNPDGNGPSGSPFDGHIYILTDSLGYKKSQFIYSMHFGWMYCYILGNRSNRSQEVPWCWIWLPGTLIGNTNPGWFFAAREYMFRRVFYTDPEDFLLWSNTYNEWFGVSKSGSSILFRDLSTGIQYTYTPGGGGVVTIPINPDGSETEDFELPPTPSAGSLSPEGFEQSNLIACGNYNEIRYSRRCSIINGKYTLISPFSSSSAENNSNYWAHGQYNAHIIGGINSFLNSTPYSNSLLVRCDNGMYVTGDIVSDRLSDENLKNNKTKIKNATHKIKKLRAASFDWNENQQIYNGRDVGLIAQDVEKVIPEAVSNRESGFKGVQYHKVIPLLVASIREKQNRINNLKQKIESLKNGKL